VPEREEARERESTHTHTHKNIAVDYKRYARQKLNMSDGDVSPASTLQIARDRFGYFLNKRDDLATRANAAICVKQRFLERLGQHLDPDFLVPPRELVIVYDMRDVDMQNEQYLRAAIDALTRDCIGLSQKICNANNHICVLRAELGRLGLNTGL
jgi:hypothetical protein